MANSPIPEGQDEAETFDETHLTPDGRDIANFDRMPDVVDVTAAEGDADDDESLDPDLFDDEDALDSFAVEEDEEEQSPRTRLEDRPERGASAEAVSGPERDADKVSNEDRNDPSRFESSELSDTQLKDLGYQR